MSHIPQRIEKDCLNCGTIVQGKYCQNCGQENIVPHESLGHMVKHFLYDITHFDSKFFDSMKYLLFKPGFLPEEYMKGRRVSYLNPIKKYVFTSAIFFFLFLTFFVPKNFTSPMSEKKRQERINKAEAELKSNPNNAKLDSFLVMLKDTVNKITDVDARRFWGEDDGFTINVGSNGYKDLKEYDSLQAALPANEKDNWFEKIFIKRGLQLQDKYRKKPGELGNLLLHSFLRMLPYMLFVSLPFFAFILKLLYFRRKQFYYADHGIFAIYHYIFAFFLLIAVFLFDKLSDVKGLSFLEIVEALFFLCGGVYLYLSMKRFYKQGHLKTLLKFIILNSFALITLLFIFLIFLIISFYIV